MKQNGSGKRKKSILTPYLLLAPSIVLFVMFTFYPFLKTIFLSFSVTDKRGDFVKFVGISNYKRVITGRAFNQILNNTLKFALMVGLGTLVIALLLALISAAKEKGSQIYEILYALPMAVASTPAASIFFFLMRKENGFLNTLLGANVAWLQDMQWALISVAMVTVWLSIGASYIFLLVGFRNVPEDLIESAIIDGAGPIRRAFSIMIPVASPQIFFVIFLNITNSFKAFAEIKLMTEGGPNKSTTTLIYNMYQNAFLNGRYETACVQAILLFLMIFVVTRVQRFLENRTVFYS